MANTFNEFFSNVEKDLGIFETGYKINTSGIQGSILAAIDKYKNHPFGN